MGVGSDEETGRIGVVVLLISALMVSGLAVAAAHGDSCGHALDDHSHHHHHHHHQHHQCGGGHDHDHHHHVGHVGLEKQKVMLPEELAEEEDLKLYGLGDEHHHHHHKYDHYHDHGAAGDAELTGIGLWIHAMGCSLLVSLASLICLIILPIIFIQGKPSKVVVDSLALFGAGAMLGDAFLHQLPHAFGGEHSHSHDHKADHAHYHSHSGDGHMPSHGHSLKDLSIGLSILAGIILFLLVEKLVRYVEDSSGGFGSWSHGHHHHHHHHHKLNKKLKDDDDSNKNEQEHPGNDKGWQTKDSISSGEKMVDGASMDAVNGEKKTENVVLRKRNAGGPEDKADVTTANASVANIESTEKEPAKSSSSLVFGYLNLFSDGVHNFTDGMALGSAFLLYGSVGGWSRTLFLLAHELPQEIGDFGILVRSGFTVSKALFFNFLSALVALAGTALALVMGQDPGQSSLIEGFTAGGFIYIAVAGVLAEMNTTGSSNSLKSTTVQLLSLMMGMGVALGISLAE